ncbi:MAG: hypothetical protein ACI9W6_001849 [Motiliproteus sp.]|jgi:hypothetical protein
MYESTFENVKSSFQPLIELAELNRKTLEKMTSVQTSYLTDCISSSIKQVQTLAASGSPQRAAELSFEMIKEFETKLTGATEQNMAALTELQTAYSSLVNDSFKDAIEGTGLNATPAAAQQAIVSAAPAKQATITKTPAKAPEAVAKIEAKPVVAAKPAAAVVAVKATPAVETKAAPVAEAKVTPVTAVKAAPVAEAKSTPVAAAPKAPVAAPVAAAPKAPVRRAAAKPTVKKTPAKPTQR